MSVALSQPVIHAEFWDITLFHCPIQVFFLCNSQQKKLYKGRVSWNPDWSETCYIAEVGLGLLILPLPSRCWDDRFPLVLNPIIPSTKSPKSRKPLSSCFQATVDYPPMQGPRQKQYFSPSLFFLFQHLKFSWEFHTWVFYFHHFHHPPFSHPTPPMPLISHKFDLS